MRKTAFLTLATIIILNFSCSSGTEPEEKKSVRDYTWTADTLTYPGSSQTLMRSIWGSSASDIYVCGHNAISDGSLWHYNGGRWLTVKLFDYIQRSSLRINSVHGTSKEDVWAVGYRITGDNPNPPPNFLYQSLILHYDGSKWVEQNVKTKSAVYSVYANGTNDVWACGEGGIVYHYDGSIWELDTLKINIPINSEYNLYSITVTNNTAQILGALSKNFGARTTYYLYENSNTEWSKVDSFLIDSQSTEWKWGINHLYTTSFGKLYGVGFGIAERVGNSWETILPQNFASFRGFHELGENNMMGCGDGGEVYHFNGVDWSLLRKLKDENVLYTGVWMEKEEVFIVGQLLDEFPQKTIVLYSH